MAKEHKYNLKLQWTGNKGFGTKNYTAYDRSHIISFPGKPDLIGSSDPLFRGDPQKWNPEELLLASLSACHMLWYLHLCADSKITVFSYADLPEATMSLEPSGSGRFTQVSLHPNIIITDQTLIPKAEQLHQIAHEKCFIANSVNFKIKITPTVTQQA